MTNILRYGVFFGLFGSIFFSFSNMFLRLCRNCGYSHGLLSDYLIPKLYLVDISVVATVLLLFFLLDKKQLLQTIKNKISGNVVGILLALCWLLLGLYQLGTLNPTVGLLQWLRLTSYGALGTGLYIFATNRNLSKYNLTSQQVLPVLRLSVASSIVFQALVSTYQWIYQKHLFGYLLLGEPLLTGQPGLAKRIQDGAELILPYGTTAHPNILGGLTALGLFMLVSFKMSEMKTAPGRVFHKAAWESLHIGAMIAGFIIIYLTQSAAAALVLLLAGLVLLASHFGLTNLYNSTHKSIVTILFLGVVLLSITTAQFTQWYGENKTTQHSWYRRAYLIESTQELIKNISWKKIGGTGLGQFTAQAPQQLRAYESALFNQPVHHVPLLIIAETGLLGLAGILFTSMYLLKRAHQKLLMINLTILAITLTPLFVWDHYLWTIAPATTMLVLATAYTALRQLD